MKKVKHVYHQKYPEETKLSSKNSGCIGCEFLEKCATSRKDEEPGICENLYKKYHSLEKI